MIYGHLPFEVLAEAGCFLNHIHIFSFDFKDRVQDNFEDFIKILPIIAYIDIESPFTEEHMFVII